MKFLIKSTTIINRGMYYVEGPPFMTYNKTEATVYEELPRGIFDKRQARLVYIWGK